MTGIKKVESLDNLCNKRMSLLRSSICKVFITWHDAIFASSVFKDHNYYTLFSFWAIFVQ